MRLLVATEKPFAAAAVEGIKEVGQRTGIEVVLLENYTSVEELKAAAKDVDAMIVRSDKVTREVVAAAENLKIVVRAGAGFDNLDLEALSEKKIVAMNTPGQNSNAVAELAIAMMIFMARVQFSGVSGSEIAGKTLGIHAYGNVGRLVAKAGMALGMKVYAYDPFVADKAIFANDGVEEVASVEELYAKSQYLSLHIPATPQTKGSIGYDLAMSMPKGATIVNTARKEVINEEGLLKAMAERKDFRYVTDIKPDAMAEFEAFAPRFFATPKKMGAQTAEANINAGIAAAEQIAGYLKEGINKFQLNKF